mmetsp:Transcript_69050/g.218237  ORF Transcript_69050/g.218237 Transcript_69050/m.218237 type:complete len:272 (-) Transcript_69050:535-1350(-)
MPVGDDHRTRHAGVSLDDTPDGVQIGMDATNLCMPAAASHEEQGAVRRPASDVTRPDDAAHLRSSGGDAEATHQDLPIVGEAQRECPEWTGDRVAEGDEAAGAGREGGERGRRICGHLERGAVGGGLRAAVDVEQDALGPQQPSQLARQAEAEGLAAESQPAEGGQARGVRRPREQGRHRRRQREPRDAVPPDEGGQPASVPWPRRERGDPGAQAAQELPEGVHEDRGRGPGPELAAARRPPLVDPEEAVAERAPPEAHELRRARAPRGQG